jgi:hypothetical protein
MPEASAKKYWVVRGSSIHNRGLFARIDIPKDAAIIEYVGEKITKAESTRRGLELEAKAKKTGGAAVYIFTLNSRYDLDGAGANNPARLMNHSCEPNCEAFISRGRIWLHAMRDIVQGEELTFNYGFGLETWEEHPCRCGKPSCVGYILDKKYWKRLALILKRRVERQKKIAALEERAADLQKTLDELDTAPKKQRTRKVSTKRKAKN